MNKDTLMRPEDQVQFETEIEETRRVKQLKDKFLDSFFKEKEEQIFELFRNIPIGSADDLVNAHHQLKSLNALQIEVQTVMNTGKMAEMSLQQGLDKADK